MSCAVSSLLLLAKMKTAILARGIALVRSNVGCVEDFLLQALHGIKPRYKQKHSQNLVQKNKGQHKKPPQPQNERLQSPQPGFETLGHKKSPKGKSMSAGRQASLESKALKTVRLYKSTSDPVEPSETKSQNTPQAVKSMRLMSVVDNRRHPTS